MKIQVRRGVFETNSSSTHCLTIIPKSKEDKEYFNFKWEIEDGYFRLRFPKDMFWETPFETFSAKMAYLTILRIAWRHGCQDDYDDRIRPVKFEQSGELDEWFNAVVARLKEKGVDIKGFDLSYNYVRDTLKKVEWSDDYDDEWMEEPPVVTKDTEITPDMKHLHLRWDIDHQVVDDNPENTVGGRILIKTMYKDPWDKTQKKPKMMDVEFDAEDPMSDIDILFNPRISILYTFDNDGIRDYDRQVSIENQLKETN